MGHGLESCCTTHDPWAWILLYNPWVMGFCHVVWPMSHGKFVVQKGVVQPMIHGQIIPPIMLYSPWPMGHGKKVAEGAQMRLG